MVFNDNSLSIGKTDAQPSATTSASSHLTGFVRRISMCGTSLNFGISTPS